MTMLSLVLRKNFFNFRGKRWIMENKPPLQNAIDALEKLSTPEKIKLAEAIGHSIPEEFSAWMEKKVDELSETDEEDIRLAEEALAEYHANPESAWMETCS
jgi:hypothetical protein